MNRMQKTGASGFVGGFLLPPARCGVAKELSTTAPGGFKAPTRRGCWQLRLCHEARASFGLRHGRRTVTVIA